MWYLSSSCSQLMNLSHILYFNCGQDSVCFLFTASCGALLPASGPLQAIPGKDGIGLDHEWSHRWPHHEASQPAKAHCTVHHCKCWDPTVNLQIQTRLVNWHSAILRLGESAKIFQIFL